MKTIVNLRNEYLVQSNSKAKSAIIWIIVVPLILLIMGFERCRGRLEPVLSPFKKTANLAKTCFRWVFPDSVEGEILLFMYILAMLGIAFCFVSDW